jgi:hypothetical protein
MRVKLVLVLALLAACLQVVAAPPGLKITGKLDKKSLLITVVDSSGAPIDGASVTVTAEMAEMDMGASKFIAKEIRPGLYSCVVSLPMDGDWKFAVKVVEGAAAPVIAVLDLTIGGGMQMDQMGSMKGRLGDWPMAKEGSGTSWLPESSPMFMKPLPKSGRYDLDLMGSFSYNYTDSGGTRGDHRFYSNSMIMLMSRRETGGGILGLNLMVSLDPLFNGEWGYPDLLQTGETAHGTQLVDWQHPHDLLSEAAVSYSHPVGRVNGFIYAGPVGEPSLGGPTFMHRPSGMEIPEAPITHHWFDSTHISWGVVTAGVNDSHWQVEGSVFNGHEPNENRYLPDPLRLDSASGRLSFAPSKNLSLNVSYGFLNSPESTAPGVDQHRLTGAALWNLSMGRNDLAVSALYGENVMQGRSFPAYLLEATLYEGPTSLFARWENVDKDELIGLPDGTYNVNKFLVGLVRDVASPGGSELGLGGYAGVYAFPQSVETYYGRPLTLGVFLRIRPKKM